ncbi:hypothetical protein [Radiobacillus sp. PE A8.2]|uniref:hypothetical protein n=1 Tax=Radiobacillus sp. PE A8.2 TaxID=3380349 RepID=UPI0038906C71
MTRTNRIIWIIGNIIVGVSVYFVFLLGVFQAWAQQGSFLLYAIGSIVVVLIIFCIFNLIIISKEKAKNWAISVFILMGSLGVTMLIYGTLQNTIFE